MARRVAIVYRDHEYPFKAGSAEIYEDIEHVRVSIDGLIILIQEDGVEIGFNRDVVFSYLNAEEDAFEAAVAQHGDQRQGDE